ncbi:phosphotransferase [Panacibacter ginsenosidivorans]|uniref:Phosphotransferase n=1 Tax=Panacibacter ginsenosidivorans TaxID=1813871 RepID=A0A5B8VCC5_9BACT|nr:phosphotransferase [Panacibacter ginsenosidivorans]QEC68591.1 phosphotransferase [Panacibacter ginsenosidivorans]
MIPEHKQPAVTKALQTVFNTDAFEHIEQLTKGLSSALIFKIMVRGKPYLLRVITRTDAMGDPSFYYGCMQVAAENNIAPHIHYMSVEDRISITDFIIEQPFSIAAAKEMMPHLLRKLHALPRFSFRMNYFDTMETFLPKFSDANILPAHETKDLFEIYERIMNVYPRNDVDNWVSCHNDSKAENIVFDGQRPWFVDWEAAFLNDRYLDLAIVANFVVINEQDETTFLETYFEEAVDAYKHARFFLMQLILHFYYFIFLTVVDGGGKPIDITTINKRQFREFHNGMWNGAISLADTDTKREYAMIHLEQFRLKAQTKLFEDSLKILSKHMVMS